MMNVRKTFDFVVNNENEKLQWGIRKETKVFLGCFSKTQKKQETTDMQHIYLNEYLTAVVFHCLIHSRNSEILKFELLNFFLTTGHIIKSLSTKTKLFAIFSHKLNTQNVIIYSYIHNLINQIQRKEQDFWFYRLYRLYHRPLIASKYKIV